MIVPMRYRIKLRRWKYSVLLKPCEIVVMFFINVITQKKSMD